MAPVATTDRSVASGEVTSSSSTTIGRVTRIVTGTLAPKTRKGDGPR